MCIVVGVIDGRRVCVGRERVIAVIAEHIILAAKTGAVEAAEIDQTVGFNERDEFAVRIPLKVVVVEIVHAVIVIVKPGYALIDMKDKQPRTRHEEVILAGELPVVVDRPLEDVRSFVNQHGGRAVIGVDQTVFNQVIFIFGNRYARDFDSAGDDLGSHNTNVTPMTEIMHLNVP